MNTAETAIRAHLTILNELMAAAATITGHANDASKRGERNVAMGSLTELGPILSNAKLALEATFVVHRLNRK